MNDIAEFAAQKRQLLLDALVAAGIPKESLFEAVHPKEPFGRWNRPVVIFSKDVSGKQTPVAQFYLSFPKVGRSQRTVKFNIATFESVLKHVHQTTNP